jgi:hypothetical protein
MLADCGLEVVGEADSAAAGSAAGERLRLDVMLPDIDGVALGHGSQQAPACARRRRADHLRTYRTLDLSALSYERIANHKPLIERAVI